MNLREQIKLFTDGDGLVSPYNMDAPGVQTNASGNGVLYLSEYIVLLRRRFDLNPDACRGFRQIIRRCMQVHFGLLHRSPTHQDQEGPDDYVGMLVGCYLTQSEEIAQAVIDYGWANKGFFNNELPGTRRHKDGRFNWSSFLVRQPQLIALAYWAAGKNPLPPFVWYTALVIAIAGWRKPRHDTDARILAWLMAQVACQQSWLCRRATSIFAKRLAKDYPSNSVNNGGMTEVFRIAFEGRNPPHPYASAFPSI